VSEWQTLEAPAKLNLALVVGPTRTDGKHEVATVLEQLTLADVVAVRCAPETGVSGFADDTLVRAALDAVGARSGVRFEARIEKRIPVAAGLGGGSSDAAAALRLANGLLDTPLSPDELHAVAARLGADVPFFLHDGPQLGTGDGSTIAPVALPRNYAVLLALPAGAVKSSTADVYAAFDARAGEAGFEERCEALVGTIAGIASREDLANLPPNDLAASPLADQLRGLGAFRADVTGAGPVVYGLFVDTGAAERARVALEGRITASWLAEPA
jgi:4-diphosphocytidyl-2-C-methyl-D-erythritol kinase